MQLEGKAVPEQPENYQYQDNFQGDGNAEDVEQQSNYYIKGKIRLI